MLFRHWEDVKAFVRVLDNANWPVDNSPVAHLETQYCGAYSVVPWCWYEPERVEQRQQRKLKIERIKKAGLVVPEYVFQVDRMDM